MCTLREQGFDLFSDQKRWVAWALGVWRICIFECISSAVLVSTHHCMAYPISWQVTIADSGSGRTQRTITASAKVIDPSNTAHALSSHQQAQKRAEEARRHAEAEKQRENQLSAPTPSSSNLSAPSSPSTSHPTSPGRRTADEARLSSSEPSSEDEGGPRPARPRNGKGLYVCYFYTETTLTYLFLCIHRPGSGWWWWSHR